MSVKMVLRRGTCLVQFSRSISSVNSKHYKVVVLGGGAGGCSVAARACRKLGAGKVAVVEPAEHHYYQPMWTLVGAGIKTVQQSTRRMDQVLPKNCVHHKNKVEGFDPDNNTVTLDTGEKLSYDYLVVGLGMTLEYHRVDGLIEAMKADPMVCSNYSTDYVVKTWPAIQNFKGGSAIFTFPNTPIKCPGAPQKIMYLADAHWNKSGARKDANIVYNTSLPVIFAIKKYADRLWKVAEAKDIKVNLRRNLASIDHKKKIAVFDLLDSKTGEQESYEYAFIHVCPPMSPAHPMKNSTSPIVDAAGFLEVNKETLQHVKYNNIFGIGDCTNIPTPRTAASVAVQNLILWKGIQELMAGKTLTGKYDGYSSCPLLTGYKKCIMAEFDFAGQPLETFPIIDQGDQRMSMFHINRDVLPDVYWKLMLNGRWSGPKVFRKMLSLGMSK